MTLMNNNLGLMRCHVGTCLLIVFVLDGLSTVSGASVINTAENQTHNGSAIHSGFQVVSINYATVEAPLAIAVWVFVATLAKIGFHMTGRLSSLCPESVLLIILGVAIGLLLFYTQLMTVSPLTPFVFFMFLLPPIVLDAGYFMPNRSFFDNIGTILLFAVVGTIFNTLTIGLSLWAIGLTGLYGVQINILESFLFSALISAVDPVAVLAVFEAVHVNQVLYIVVFGESLLNDAVTVVLYHMFETYSEMGESNVGYSQVLLGFASFFVVAIGGTTIGIIWGFFTAFVTRFTTHVRVVEPLIVFVMAYLAHITAELFHMSGILAVTFCGICSKNYVEANISQKSHTTLKYTMKMLSSLAETIIFLFLGVSTVNGHHDWNTWFIIFTIFFCTVFRAIGVIVLTSIANHFRVHKLNKVEQFVMAYGGLRGAVAFALAMTIDKREIIHKSMFVTATIAVVFFTVFVQGITIKPLVRLLKVKRSEKRKMTMNERIHERFMDHLMAGIEEVTGKSGKYHLRDKFKYYDNNYIRKWLLRDHRATEPKILETFTKLNLKDNQELLNVQNGVILNNPELTLAGLLRNYTQTNLNSLKAKGSQEYLTSDDTSNLLNIDLQEISYSPSDRDLSDAHLHHILKDSMFPTSFKNRRYSRIAVDDDTKHPPFQHQMRMQIRRMLNEQKRRNKGRRYDGNNYLVVDEPNGDYNAKYKKSDEDDDGGGITFIVPTKSVVDSANDLASSSTDNATTTEQQLPWKRNVAATQSDEELVNDDLPIIQQEFPFWVENKDYNAYASPTSTYLNRINDDNRLPAYEIFNDSDLDDGNLLQKNSKDEK